MVGSNMQKRMTKEIHKNRMFKQTNLGLVHCYWVLKGNLLKQITDSLSTNLFAIVLCLRNSCLLIALPC